MSTQVLTCETLHDLDEGRVGSMIDSLFRKANADILDRPGEGKARKISLTFFFTPKTLSDGSVEKIDIHVKGKSIIPDYATGSIDAALRKTGGVIFASNSPDNVDQTTFQYPKED